MRRAFWVYKNGLNIEAFYATELRRIILKYLVRNFNLDLIDYIFITERQRKYKKKSSLSSFRRFCLISGYPRSVFRHFKLSRHLCKTHASFGNLVGMRKSSF